MILRSRGLVVDVDSSGNSNPAGVYTDAITGLLYAIKYNYTFNTTIPYDAGVDMVVRTQTTLIPILTKSNFGGSEQIWYPRPVAHKTDGSQAAQDASNFRRAMVPLVNEGIEIVISQGGNAKTGRFYFYFFEMV